MTNPVRPRAVFDCVIFVQAVLSQTGPAAECLRLVENGKVELLLSDQTLAELRRVLSSPRFRNWPGLWAALGESMEEFFSRLRNISSELSAVPEHVALDRDAKDAPYLNLAIEGQAEYLVTRDKDLLDLRIAQEAGDPATARFRFQIMNPAEFLSHIRLTLHG